VAKLFRYIRWTQCCDVAFVVFGISWIVTRHGLFPMVILSLYNDAPRQITYGCYLPASDGETFVKEHWESVLNLVRPLYQPEAMVCFDWSVRWMFLVTLISLQIVLFPWTFALVKVATKRLSSGETKDNRSEDESDQEDRDSLCTSRTDLQKSSR
jgi:very-long-chain ceramide synthase